MSPRAGIGTENPLRSRLAGGPPPSLGRCAKQDQERCLQTRCRTGDPSGDPEDECGVGDMASSSEDSADEEQPGRELDEIAEAEALGQWHGRVDLAKLGESPQFYRHSMSRVLHLLAEEGGTTFKCGRTVSGAYEFWLRRRGYFIQGASSVSGPYC